LGWCQADAGFVPEKGKQAMTLFKAYLILLLHQKWRVGGNLTMLEPRTITEAIETILAELESRGIQNEGTDTE